MTYFQLKMHPRGIRIESRFDVEVRSNGELVIIHERRDNKGRSITNAAEEVLTELVKLRTDITRDTIFVEHYPEREPNRPATYDLIIPVWRGDKAVSVRWSRLGEDMFELLKGNYAVLASHV